VALKTESREMSFLDHLEELRWRLIKCLIAVIVFAIPSGIFWKQIFDIIMVYPLRFSDPKPHLIFTNPTEGITLSIEIAIVSSIILSAPIIFFQLWRFISPGLYKNEKKFVLPLVISTTFFFLLGTGFCYLVVPFILSFFAKYPQGRMDAFYRVQDYLTFLVQLSLAFGIVFELPVISFILTKAGIITHRFLIDKGRYAIVIIFIVAAILTPPDILSQLALALPLLILYGISILVSYCIREKKRD